MQTHQPPARNVVASLRQAVVPIEQGKEMAGEIADDNLVHSGSRHLLGHDDAMQSAPDVVNSVAGAMRPRKTGETPILVTAATVRQMLLGRIQSAQQGVLPEADALQKVYRLAKIGRYRRPALTRARKQFRRHN